MAYDHQIVRPGRVEGRLLSESGEERIPPLDWGFLPAGDAAITRSVKAKGPVWVVQVPRGRRIISKGIWARQADILASRKQIQDRRSTPEYARQRVRDLSLREAKQLAYVDAFLAQVIRFLDFHPRYQQHARVLGEKITAHATPVNSGTVARTRLIPIENRARAAVIAWMRHRTTAYESMPIPRIKGKRREIRRALAIKSVEILAAYRQGREIAQTCPLKKALG
ncbi:MAG: DUF2293 domain-containing protein [Proteobacteria bacterium]|nr:DUF2293 domain-containing protein [Pseudomonadota bacterium]